MSRNVTKKRGPDIYSPMRVMKHCFIWCGKTKDEGCECAVREPRYEWWWKELVAAFKEKKTT